MVTYSQRILKGGRMVAWQRFARFRMAVKAIRRYADIVPAEQLLDIGAADGIGLPFLKPIAKRITSVNYYENHTREFRIAHPDEPIITADARALTLPNENFDICTSFETLNCVPTRSDRRKCFKEIHRILKPGGLFVCSVPIEIGYPALIKFVARACTQHQTPGMNLQMTLKHCCYRCFNIEQYDKGCHLGFNVHNFVDDIRQSFEVLHTKSIPITFLFPMNLLIVARRK